MHSIFLCYSIGIWNSNTKSFSLIVFTCNTHTHCIFFSSKLSCKFWNKNNNIQLFTWSTWNIKFGTKFKFTMQFFGTTFKNIRQGWWSNNMLKIRWLLKENVINVKRCIIKLLYQYSIPYRGKCLPSNLRLGNFVIILEPKNPKGSGWI